MRTITLRPDTPVGSPSPFVLTSEEVDAIGRALVRESWVREAHLPAMDGEQVLLVVPRRGHSPDLSSLSTALGDSFSALGVAVMSGDDPRLAVVRALDTATYRGPDGSPEFHERFLHHLGAVLDRGIALENWLGDREDELDLRSGTIVLKPKGFFTRSRKLAIQVLGIESQDTWTWAWADLAAIPAAVARAADSLRRRESGIPEFVTPTLSLDDVGAVQLSIAACGCLRGSVLLRVPSELGATHVMVCDPVPELDRAPTGRDIIDVLYVFSRFTLGNARTAVESFARARGVAMAKQGKNLVLTGCDGDTASVRFDDMNRIRSVEQTIT